MEISICVGSACHLKGSYDVIKELESLVESHRLKDQIAIKGAFCLGHCTEAVSVKFAGRIFSVRKDTAKEFFENNVLSELKGTVE